MNETAYGIEDWAKVWQILAEQALGIMLKGGDPHSEEAPRSRPTKEPMSVLTLCTD